MTFPSTERSTPPPIPIRNQNRVSGPLPGPSNTGTDVNLFDPGMPGESISRSADPTGPQTTNMFGGSFKMQGGNAKFYQTPTKTIATKDDSRNYYNEFNTTFELDGPEDFEGGQGTREEKGKVIASDEPSYGVTITQGGVHHYYPENPPPMRDNSTIGPSNFLVGREEKLEEIKEKINSGNGAPLVVLHGMSGAGKSALAHQYANIHRNEYRIACAIDATDKDSMAASFKKLGDKILGEEDSKKSDKKANPSDVIDFVLSRLHEAKDINTLLILDGLNGRELFDPYFKQHELDQSQIPHIHTIITTSKRDLMVGRSQARIRVEMLDDKSAVDLTLKIIDGRNPNVNDKEALELIKKLGNHPLAITHAATYLGIRADKNVAYYLKEYSRFYKEAKKINTEQSSVYATLRASIDQIEKKLKGASTVLTFVSFFGNEKIPSSLFDHMNSSDKKSIRSARSRKELEFALCTPSRVEKVLEALDEFSIIHFDQPDTFSMHRLVQVVSQDFLRGEETAWRESMLEAATLAFPKEIDSTNMSSIKDIALCAQKVIGKFPKDYKSLGAAHVYYLNAAYHYEIGSCDIAKDQIQKAIEIYKKSSMPNDKKKLDRCRNLREQIREQVRVQSTSSTDPARTSQQYSTPASSTSQITIRDLTDIDIAESRRPSSTYSYRPAPPTSSMGYDGYSAAAAPLADNQTSALDRTLAAQRAYYGGAPSQRTATVPGYDRAPALPATATASANQPVDEEPELYSSESDRENKRKGKQPASRPNLTNPARETDMLQSGQSTVPVSSSTAPAPNFSLEEGRLYVNTDGTSKGVHDLTPEQRTFLGIDSRILYSPDPISKNKAYVNLPTGAKWVAELTPEQRTFYGIHQLRSIERSSQGTALLVPVRGVQREAKTPRAAMKADCLKKKIESDKAEATYRSLQDKAENISGANWNPLAKIAKLDANAAAEQARQRYEKKKVAFDEVKATYQLLPDESAQSSSQPSRTNLEPRMNENEEALDPFEEIASQLNHLLDSKPEEQYLQREFVKIQNRLGLSSEDIQRAAEKDNNSAQRILGKMNLNGIGGVEKNPTTAAKWYTKAAEDKGNKPGNKIAQNNLGNLYENGIGVEKNLTTALELYAKAAYDTGNEPGNIAAQVNLGRLYENGIGVKKNLTVAAKWYTKAAEDKSDKPGNMNAQFRLGYLYDKQGLSVKKNLATALEWYTKAAEQGQTDALKRLDYLVYREWIKMKNGVWLPWYAKKPYPSSTGFEDQRNG